MEIIENDHFFFEADKDLEKVCNAPKDKEGFFEVVELRNGRVNTVYIGCSNSCGLYDEIVNGMHYDKNPRKIGWKDQMIKDETDTLDIYWHVTNGKYEQKKELTKILEEFVEQRGNLPKWNK